MTSPEPPPPSFLTRKIDPLASVWKHKWLALAVGFVVCLVGLPAAYSLGKPVYYTEAVIYISPRFLKNLESDTEQELQSNTQYREYVQQQVRTINRYDIVAKALERLGDNRFRWWQKKNETERRAIERLQQSLRVKPVSDTYQIVVGLEGPEASGLAEIVNSVVDVFLETAKNEEFFASDARIDLLQDERRKLLQEIDEKVVQRTQLAQELGVTTFNESLSNPYDELLLNNRKALAAAQKERIQAEATLATIYTEAQPEGTESLKAIVQEMVAKDPGLNSLKANLNLRRSELLTRSSGLTADHPGRKAAERELTEIDTELKRATDQLADHLTKMLITQKKTEVARSKQIEANLQTEVLTQSNTAAWFASKYNQALAVGAEIDRARKRLYSIDDRINLLMLETKAPGFARRFSEARTPEVPIKGGKTKFFLFFVAAAGGLAVAVPIALDQLDPRLYSADEVTRLAGFPPLGSISNQKNSSETLPQTDSMVRLANRIAQERNRNQSQIFVMTAPKTGCGTTTVALSLGKSLDDLGMRTIVVETNPETPDERFHPPTGDHSQSVGLSQLLSESLNLQSAILTSTELAPNRIGVGPINGIPHWRNTRKLAAVLDELSQEFDCVLLDAPPLANSAETELLAGLTDGVFLVVDAQTCLRPEVTRSLKVLEKLDPKVVGIIFNRATGNEK